MTEVLCLPRIATMATMASRQESFEQVLPVIHAQVDHVFIYLDGYSERPEFLQNFDRITVSHAEAVGDLHCSSRLLCLQELDEPALVLVVDDDIVYPSNYAAVLAKFLNRIEGQAMVGVHGRIFMPPHRSYARDAMFLKFSAGMKRPCQVHELGVGTCAFVSDHLDVDPRQWDRHDMNDLTLATEAQRRGLQRWVIARPKGWLRPNRKSDQDSLWFRTRQDDSEQSRRMRAFLQLYANIDAVNEPARAFQAARERIRTPA